MLACLGPYNLGAYNNNLQIWDLATHSLDWEPRVVGAFSLGACNRTVWVSELTTYYCNSPLEPSAESQGQEAERETEDRRSSSRDQISCALSPIYQNRKKRKLKWGNRVKPEHGQRGSEV